MRANRAKIVLINVSNGRVTDSSMMKIAQAIGKQVNGDFARAWGIDAAVTLMRRGDRSPPDPNAWWVAVLENPGQPEAAGYHDLTPQGKPLAVVHADLVEADGEELSVVISREVLEMLADPGLSGFEHHRGEDKLYAREVCDPVQGAQNVYSIQGVRLSDFVYPAFFQDGATGPFNHRRTLKAPFEIAPGGFLPSLHQADATSWSEAPPQDMRPDSRLERRLRALAEALVVSDISTNAPLAAAPRVEAPVPARRTPQHAGIRPSKFRPIPPVPHRQPDRGGNAAIPGINPGTIKVPARQQLRGSRLLAAQAAEEARAQAVVLDPPKVPARQPNRGKPERKPTGEAPKLPARQPLRGGRAPEESPPGDSAGASGAVDSTSPDPTPNPDAK